MKDAITSDVAHVTVTKDEKLSMSSKQTAKFLPHPYRI